eukprot:4122265-Prymnesium_polylepis.1
MEMQRSLVLFTDWLNQERHGISVAGKHYALRLTFVGDYSTPDGVTAAVEALSALQNSSVTGLSDASRCATHSPTQPPTRN